MYWFSTEKILGRGIVQYCETALIDSFVSGSTSDLFLISIKRPYLCKKSAPIMGFSIFAIVKTNGNSRRNPKFTFNIFFPYVEITDPLAAVKIMSDGLLWFLNFEEGKTEMSAPLSIKNFNLLVSS